MTNNENMSLSAFVKRMIVDYPHLKKDIVFIYNTYLSEHDDAESESNLITKTYEQINELITKQ